jgi:leucyl-tRNA synthetase
MGRKELILNVETQDGRSVVVDTDESTEFIVPHFGPDATINQVRYHLDVEKMSKSKGNVVAPDQLVQEHGADTVRAYLMFAFEWEKGGPWNSQGIQGPKRWLNEVWDLVLAEAPQGIRDEKADRALCRKVHQTIKKVEDGLKDFGFNTAIASLMTLKNDMQAAYKSKQVSASAWNSAVENLLLLMAPFTPFVAEELWARTGHKYSIHNQMWPAYDAEIAAEEEITLVIQVNGKVRDRIQVPAEISEDDAKRLALESEGAVRHMEGKPARKVIYIAKNGMVNIVI